MVPQSKNFEDKREKAVYERGKSVSQSLAGFIAVSLILYSSCDCGYDRGLYGSRSSDTSIASALPGFSYPLQTVRVLGSCHGTSPGLEIQVPQQMLRRKRLISQSERSFQVADKT